MDANPANARRTQSGPPAGTNGGGPAAPPVRTPGAQAVQQMTAGQLVELMQDVEANTPVWQVGDDDDLVPVYFVDVSRSNGLVQKLVIR